MKLNLTTKQSRHPSDHYDHFHDNGKQTQTMICPFNSKDVPLERILQSSQHHRRSTMPLLSTTVSNFSPSALLSFKSPRCSLFTVCLIVFSCLCSFSSAFNVETSFPVIHRGVGVDHNSFFGFSIWFSR